MAATYRNVDAAHLGLVATLVLALVGGCNPAPIVPKASTQALSFPALNDVGSLDPASAGALEDAEIGQNLFDGLVKFDDQLNVVPDIASEMPAVSADGKTYTFKLRRDVNFWNGDRVTATDVLYSWNRAAAMHGDYAGSFAPVLGYETVAANQAFGSDLENLLERRDASVMMAGLVAPDDFTVKVMMSRPAGWFLSAMALADAVGMVVDERAVRQNPDGWWSNPATAVGTGSFRLTSYVPKQSLDFSAVPNWWGSPKPTLKTVHIDVSTTNASTAILKYEQGGYDLYGYAATGSAPVADLARIRADPNEKRQLTLSRTNSTVWVSFNLVHDASRAAGGPFLLADGQSAHDLRMAFALAIDKVKLAQVVCLNLACQPAISGLIPKGLKGYLGDGADPLGKFDPAKARQLLQQADPHGTKSASLTYTFDPGNALNAPVAEFLQSQWLTNLGVTVALEPVERTTFITERLRGRYVLSRDNWVADYDHPQDWFDNEWGSAAGCPDGYCTTGYDTPAYDELLAKADAESGDQALNDYRKLSQMLIADAVYIPLYYPIGTLLVKPYVVGAGSSAFTDFHWSTIRILSH